jgi:Na+-driven multidrug efflux pump
LGAKNIKNAYKSVSLALKITSGILLLISFFYFIFASELFKIFTDNPEIIFHGTRYIRIIAVFEVFLAFEVVLGGAFSGAGDTKPPFLIIFPVTLLRIPASYLFSVLLDYGVAAIWMTIALTTFLKGVLLFCYFKRGQWTQKKV